MSKKSFSPSLAKLYKITRSLTKPINIIITQLDPDAVGSALGLQLLMQFFGKSANIYYAGAIGHDQNKGLFKKYNLYASIKPLSELTNNEGAFALVDSSSTTDSRLQSLIGLDPLIVIDHHRGSNVVENKHNMILIEEVGAASTLVTELLKEISHIFDSRENIATCLAVGIYTDTKDLVSADKRDRAAYEFLCKNYNQIDFLKILRYTVSRSAHKNFKNALVNAVEKGPRLISGLGFIEDERGDDLSTASDYLIKIEGINLVIVWGVLDKKVIRLSVRSSEEAPFDLNEFLKQRIQSAGAKLAPDGHGEGGGRIEFNLEEWLNNNEQIDPLTAIQKKMEKLFFEKE